MNKQSFLQAVVTSLIAAAEYDPSDQSRPLGVLWTDKKRQWEPLVPRLREQIPLVTLGPYDPAMHTGPVYWIRCMLSRTIEEDVIPEDEIPVIYLPGVGHDDLRSATDLPTEQQPLIELTFSCGWWRHPNGKDFTVAGFMENEAKGLGLDLSGDSDTAQALLEALPKLADEPVSRLQGRQLGAGDFRELIHPDFIKGLLNWLNDPAGYKKTQSANEWSNFQAQCKKKFAFDPEKDGEVTGAELLGAQIDEWAKAWNRYSEAPPLYPNLSELLNRARPDTLFVEHPESWPQDNERLEADLKTALLELADCTRDDALAKLQSLEQEHSMRRSWVWAGMGEAPLATALEALVALGKATEQNLAGQTAEEVASDYVERGWQADAAVVKALSGVDAGEDARAVMAAIKAIYRPWVDQSARHFQARVKSDGLARPVGRTWPEGTCLIFFDGLRVDAAQLLKGKLEQQGLGAELTWEFSAVPAITETSKPAVSPVADQLGAGDGLGVVKSETGSKINAGELRKLMRGAGYQILKASTLGDPNGRAWTELGELDEYGHKHGWKIARHVEAEIDDLHDRVNDLLKAGWQQVVVLTDHGWLLLPGEFEKIDLALPLTDVRKGRCARLKKDASGVDHQTLPWHWDASVQIALAPGICSFVAGKEYDHGGLSPQECVVPILKIQGAEAPVAEVNIISIKWTQLRCRIELSEGAHGLMVDIRSKPADASTTLVASRGEVKDDGSSSVLIEDAERMGESASVVVVSDDKVIVQQLVVVGGP